MSQFIELSDYGASIHSEILDAITRNDESIIEVCEDRAIADMRGYLSKRYDCDALFSATGSARNQLVLMMLIDITVYHLFCIHNPRNISEIRKDRYERAVDWMKAVKRGLDIDGAPLLASEERKANSRYGMRSNPKRVNRY